MTRGRVLISGAGIAGSALAYWLGQAGYRTTVVERADQLREGGQAVDFRGPVHRTVLERMGIWGAIHQKRTVAGELSLVNRHGAPFAVLPELMMAGEVEILRGDLVRLLYERSSANATYRFGERIVGLEDRGQTVGVEFERAPPEVFDFVIGADGLHSGVRALAFAPEESSLRHRGYRIASFAMPNVLEQPRGAACYAEVGRGAMLSVTSETQARALLVHTGEPMGPDARDAATQKTALAARFANMGWRVPELLHALGDASDLYVDATATVDVESYSRGRIALLGDAAYGGTLGGQGTSLAIVGAYVLAQELCCTADPRAAFKHYESLFRSYAHGCQKGAARAGQFFAPRTRLGLTLRNCFYSVLASRAFSGVFERLVKSAASDFALPSYAAP